MARTRKPSKIAFITGGVLLVAALVWMLVAVPALVKYPTDVDSSPQYEGTFTLFVNPVTMTALEEPTKVPLSVDRHIEAIASESSSDRVLVRETIKQKAGDLVDTTQTNQYVMDRTSLKNVADPRAYAFEPANVVDRSGSYRLNLPFGTESDATYPIYKNEIGTPYPMKPLPVDKITLEGLSLTRFTGVMTDAPFTDAYLAQLRKSLPLPETTTFDAMKPQLKEAGFDVDAVMAKLVPLMTAEESSTLAEFAAKPIPLEYTLSFDGAAAVEGTTGAQVKVDSRDTYGVRPKIDEADLAAVFAIVNRYADRIPEIAGADAVLEGISTAPSIALAEFDYAQTPASVADIAQDVKDSRQSIVMAKQWIPMGLALLAGVALLVGAWEWPRRGRRHPAPVPARGRRPVEA